MQNLCCWTDENGVRNFSDSPPSNHVINFETRKMAPNHRKSEETKVILKRNHVIVPMTLAYRGKEVATNLLPDTGASTTAFNRKIADMLNIKASNSRTVRVADGRGIPARSVDLDYIVVGPQRITNFRSNAIDPSGDPENFDGLLGMDFPRGVDYHVNFTSGVLFWERF